MRAFSSREYEDRVRRVREAMAERRIDACIITSPENVYYLTGLNHQGYFAYTSLILPLERDPVLISRAMERAIVRDMLPGLRHAPYSDGVEPLPSARDETLDLAMAAPSGQEEVAGLNPWSMSLGISIQDAKGNSRAYSAPAETTCRVLEELKLQRARVAFEKNSSFLPYQIAENFVARMTEVEWLDADDLVTECRIVQSPDEIAYTRKAAEISDAMVMAATALAGPGIPKQDIMAAIYLAMCQRGGTYPAFVPLVRSTTTLEHEHGTWDAHRLQKKDLLFLEMAGCHWRYHAPVGRLVSIGRLSPKTEKISKVALDAHYAAADTLRPGATADAVYSAWKARVDAAGLTHYHRHHCGYVVGIGFPPSWSGSGVPKGLRAGSTMVLRTGMVFHLMSWLLRTGRGDAFYSDTVVVTDKGCEFLTKAPRDPIVR